MPAQNTQLTALQSNRISCHGCGLLVTVESEGQHKTSCDRCGATLHSRNTNSLNRTWALLLTAAILYIPANLLPITLTSSMGKTEGDTIMQGVIYFMTSGDWPIAMVIFTASILVPMLKMVALFYLLLSIRLRSPRRQLDRTKIYRMVEFVGRWSMIDVFVVTIMVALVRLGSFATIEAGTGAVFFCAVVIITMLAAESFDQRLIWDECEADD